MSQHNVLLHRDLGHALEVRDAIPRPQTFDAAARTVEAVIASSQPVQRQDARGSFLEILDPAGLDLAGSRGASVLDSHQRDLAAVLGTLDSVRVEGNQVIGLIRFSSRPEIEPVLEDVRSGVIQHLSVGYQVDAWRDGTDGAGNRTRTATKWRIGEVSFVTVPADRSARTRSAPMNLAIGHRAEINRQIRTLAQRAGVSLEVTNALIDRGVSVAEAREEILFEMQVRGQASIQTAHNRASLDDPANRVRAMAGGLYARVEPRFVPSAAARQFAGLTIPELAREVLHRSGATTQGLSAVSLIERALHTTSDFSLILADSVGRTLRASYTAATSTVRQLARETTAQDFRTKHRLMLDSSGLTLEKVNEHGEYKSGTMSESEETYAIDSFGRIFGITRKALVNDDIGAFSDLSRRLGAAAANFEAQFLVDLLTAQAGLGPDMRDDAPLFDASHGNVSGTGAAPSETTLSAARLAMRKQTGPSGGLISVTPRFVLIPSDMETATEKLLTQIQAVTTDDVNPFVGLRLIVEPRLTDTHRWYVVADPAQIDGLEFAYLAGSPGPQVESRAGFEVDGVEIKVRLDFGAGFVDWRSWYSNAGV